MIEASTFHAFSGKSDALVAGLVLLDVWRFVRPLEPGWTWDERNSHVDAVTEPSARIDYIFVGFPTAGQTGKPLTAGLEVA